MQNEETRFLSLPNTTFGNLYHLNHPLVEVPTFVNFSQHLSVPIGNVLSIELHDVKFGSEQPCDDGSSVEVLNSKSIASNSLELFPRRLSTNMQTGTEHTGLCVGQISKLSQIKLQFS